MILGERQELFMRLLPRLLDKAHELGFDLRGGDLFRDARLHGQTGEEDLMAWLLDIASDVFSKAEDAGYGYYGNVSSNHKLKCAIDLNLFKDGEYLTTTADHFALGSFWDDLHPNTRWGGHYDDANHYELLEEAWTNTG